MQVVAEPGTQVPLGVTTFMCLSLQGRKMRIAATHQCRNWLKNLVMLIKMWSY